MRGGGNRDAQRAGQKTLTIFRTGATVDLIPVQNLVQQTTSISNTTSLPGVRRPKGHGCEEPHPAWRCPSGTPNDKEDPLCQGKERAAKGRQRESTIS